MENGSVFVNYSHYQEHIIRVADNENVSRINLIKQSYDKIDKKKRKKKKKRSPTYF